MNPGRVFAVGLGLFAAIFGAVLWYYQTWAYYERQDGLTEVMVVGAMRPVSDYQGIDAISSPIKLRACFTAGWPFPGPDPYMPGPEPLTAPRWFDCFDARQIGRDIEAGAVAVLLAESNVPWGFDRYIVQYPDNRAFMWRQLNSCGAAVFSGEPAPEGCPPDPESNP